MAGGGGDMVMQTLQLLEWRLRRLEYVLHGEPGEIKSVDAGQTVMKRIGKIEDGLGKLAGRYGVVNDLTALKSKHPHLFTGADAKPDEPDSDTKLAMVLTEAPSFPATASQLTQLNDLPLPPTQAFTALIASLPRMAAADRRQREQAVQISELRKRSGILLLKWHELFVLGQGRCWAEWDGRLKEAEKKVRREEFRRTQEDGVI